MFWSRKHKIGCAVVASVMAVGLMMTALAETAVAGPFEDGVAAYQRGDYATALRLLRPLAEHGNANAQFNLGTETSRTVQLIVPPLLNAISPNFRMRRRQVFRLADMERQLGCGGADLA
jgi:hypothetical protein